jgi:hypothetical protein
MKICYIVEVIAIPLKKKKNIRPYSVHYKLYKIKKALGIALY